MRIFICTLALVATITAQVNPIENMTSEQILTASNDQFTAQFLQKVIAANPNNSFVISAFSVLSPLAQLALTATGKSHDELLAVLNLPNDNVTKEVFSDVTKRLKGSKEDLKLANRVYVRNGENINSKFATLSREVFDLDVKNIDFTKNQAAATEINTWVEDHTNHRIKELVNPDALGPDTSCILVNAIYFKGMWEDRFTAAGEMDFHVTKDKTVKLPQMKQNKYHPYADSKELDAQLVQIGYKGGKSSLLVVLPKQVDGINNLIEKLKDPAALNNAIKTMTDEDVNIILPKFKIETTTDLKDVLTKMNTTSIFSPTDAHLDNLIEGASNLYVSDATQKAFIEVNEEGVEAAAANQFGIAYLSAFVSNPIKFTAAHPFLFFLKEGNTILFSGIFRA